MALVEPVLDPNRVAAVLVDAVALAETEAFG